MVVDIRRIKELIASSHQGSLAMVERLLSTCDGIAYVEA